MNTRSRHFAVVAVFAAITAFAPRASAQDSLLWSRWYELPEASDGDCYATAIAIKPNGDTISAVYTGYAPARRFLAYGPAGHLKWSTKAGPQTGVTYRNAMVDAAGNSYFVGSSGSSTIIALSLGPTGTFRWETSFSVPLGWNAYEAVFDESGQRVVVGLTEMPGAVTSHVTSFAASDGTTTDQTFDFATSGSESVQTLAVDDAGFVYVCGFTEPTGFVAKISPSGQVVWMHVVPASLVDRATYEQIAIAEDGTLALLGEALSPAHTEDLLVTLLDPAGNTVWSVLQDSGGGTGVTEQAADITFASDGSIWSCGTMGTGLFLTRHARADGTSRLVHTPITVPVTPRPPRVFPGNAGQMWLVAGDQPPGSPTEGVTALVYGVEADGAIGSITRLAVWDLFFDYLLADSAMNEQQSLSLVGRTSDTPGTFFFDEPAWAAKFDTRSVPDGYCVAQVNSLGCTPNLTYSGLPSTSETSGFEVRVDRLLDHRYGLFFYAATSAVSVPFQGGTKCVANPVRRTPILDTGSLTSTTGNCSGRLSLDWNAFASGALGGSPAPELSVVGTNLFLQAWTRDPQSPSGSNLSSALRYVVLP